MVNVPWYMLSPSPITIIQYILLAWIAYRFFIKNVTYKRASKLMALCDSAFIVAFFVVITDAVWCACCALKWTPLYPQDTWQITSSFLRDIAGSILFYLFIGNYFKHGILTFSRLTKISLVVNVVMSALWFALAPSIGYTDYTQAWKLGYSTSFIISDLFFSHILMRIPLWVAFIAVFPKNIVNDRHH